MDAHVSFDPREDAYSMPLDQIDVSVPRALPGRRLPAVFRAAAQRGSGALLPRQPLRPVLVGDQVQGHHAVAVNHQVFSSKLGTRRRHARGPAEGLRTAELHPDGPAEA